MFEKNLILFLDKEYKDKKELLTDLSKAVDLKVTSSEDYEKAVKERENTISTFIGYETAIPHAKTDAVKSSGVHQQEQEESMAENKMEMDPEVLRTTARKVETSAGDVRKELKRFTSVIEGLSSTWSSEVKDRFLQNYQKDRAALLEMAEQYTEVAEGLLGIADELEQTEEEISSQIRAAAKS